MLKIIAPKKIVFVKDSVLGRIDYARSIMDQSIVVSWHFFGNPIFHKLLTNLEKIRKYKILKQYHKIGMWH